MSSEPLRFGRYDYAAFSGFCMYSVCSLVIPLMLVAMARDLDFPLDAGGMSSGGLLHVFRSAFMVLALLICSIIAAKWGKRLTMGFSILMFGTGILCCSLANAYWMLLPCLVLAGFGEGVIEGIATPFIQDLHPKSPERYVNIGHSFWSVGICLAVFLVGGLITLDVPWRLVMGAVGVLSLVSALLFLVKENPANKYPEVTEKLDFATLWAQTCTIVHKKRFWYCCIAMFFGAGAEFGLTFWSASYIQLTFKTSAFVAGLGTGAIAVGMFLGRTYFGYIAKPERLRYILLGAGAGTIPVTVGLACLKPGCMPDWMLFTMLFLLLFLAGIGIAPYWPTTQVYGVLNLPDCDSTLLYVFYSTLGIPGCGFFSWLMGWVGDSYGLSGTILVVPACLVVFIAVVVYECWYSAGKEKRAKLAQ